jgi:hypothetical protein
VVNRPEGRRHTPRGEAVTAATIIVFVVLAEIRILTVLAIITVLSHGRGGPGENLHDKVAQRFADRLQVTLH